MNRFRTHSRPSTPLLGLFVLATLSTAACGKKEADKKAEEKQAEKPTQGTEAPQKEEPAAVAKAPEAPLPDLGYPLETFYPARLLQKCVMKYGVAEKVAERMAIDWTEGKKPEVNLDAVLLKTKPVAKPEVPDDHRMELMREKWRNAVRLAEEHTATAEKLKAETETCLYAPEVGMIEGKTIDTYVKVFVDVTCLQKSLTVDGKVDDVQHAQAAAKIFTENGMTAGEFSRYGLIFARFPVVVQKQYAERGKKCPDDKNPQVLAPPPAPTAIYNGGVEGERIGAIRLEVREGKLTGAVQWQGVPPPAPDGRPQGVAILPLNGTINAKTYQVSGDMQGETFKLQGKVEAAGLTGTWTNVRPDGKAKGTFKAELLKRLNPGAAPPK